MKKDIIISRKQYLNPRILLLTIILLFLSCEEELTPYETDIAACLNDFPIICHSEANQNYFKAKIKNQSFCIANNQNNYKLIVSLASRSTTYPSNPNQDFDSDTGLHGIAIEFVNSMSKPIGLPDINFRTPFYGKDTFDIIKAFDDIGKHQYLPVGTTSTSIHGDYYLFELIFTCNRTGFKPNGHPRETTRQSLTYRVGSFDNKLIEVVAFNKTELPNHIKYDIRLAINMPLYYRNRHREDVVHYADLKNGDFNCTFYISK